MLSKHRVGIIVGTALLFVVVLMVACTSGEEVDSVEGLVMDERNNGGQVELVLGEMVIVRLESNPSTGYGWEIVELDEGVLQQRGGVGFESSVPDNPPPGTGGWAIFRFEAVGEGESELRLIYHQSWTEEEPLAIYTVQILVR